MEQGFTDFLEKALENEPATPFRIPPGVRLVKIDADTGELPGPNTRVIIDEAFRPGTEPGIGAFQSAGECFSISGACGDGTTSSSLYGSFDPERDAGVVPEEQSANPNDPFAQRKPPEQVAGDDLDDIY